MPSRNPGAGTGNSWSGGGLAVHPGAGSGGVEVSSDTQGVDFSSWLQRWHRETEHTWDPLIPDEVNPPILKSGTVADPIQGAAQRPADGRQHGAGGPLRRHGSGSCCVGRAYRLELPAAAEGIPRAVSGAARTVSVQHGAAE